MRSSQIFLDFEATSLHGGWPTEVGLATLNVKSGEIDTWSALIALPDELIANRGIWDPAATAIKGITPDLLRSEGKPIPDIAAGIRRILAGHNAVFADGGLPFDLLWWKQLDQLVEEVGAGALPAVEIRHAETLFETGDLSDEQRFVRFRKRMAREDDGATRHRAGADARRLAESVRDALSVPTLEAPRPRP